MTTLTFPIKSFCFVDKVEDRKLILTRVADLVDGQWVAPDINNNIPLRYENRVSIFARNLGEQPGDAGIWEWSCKPSPDDSRFDHVTSNRISGSPVQMILVDSKSELQAMVDQLKTGININTPVFRLDTVFAVRTGGGYSTVLVRAGEFEYNGSAVRLSPEANAYLPCYTFSEKDVLTIYDFYNYRMLRKDELPATDKTIGLSDPAPVIREMFLDRLSWSFFRDVGLGSKKDWANVKSIMENILTPSLTDEVATSIGCSKETSAQLIRDMISNADKAFEAKDFDIELLNNVIANNDSILEICAPALKKRYSEFETALLDHSENSLKNISANIARIEEQLTTSPPANADELRNSKDETSLWSSRLDVARLLKEVEQKKAALESELEEIRKNSESIKNRALKDKAAMEEAESARKELDRLKNEYDRLSKDQDRLTKELEKQKKDAARDLKDKDQEIAKIQKERDRLIIENTSLLNTANENHDIIENGLRYAQEKNEENLELIKKYKANYRSISALLVDYHNSNTSAIDLIIAIFETKPKLTRSERDTLKHLKDQKEKMTRLVMFLEDEIECSEPDSDSHIELSEAATDTAGAVTGKADSKTAEEENSEADMESDAEEGSEVATGKDRTTMSSRSLFSSLLNKDSSDSSSAESRTAVPATAGGDKSSASDGSSKSKVSGNRTVKASIADTDVCAAGSVCDDSDDAAPAVAPGGSVAASPAALAMTGNTVAKTTQIQGQHVQEQHSQDSLFGCRFAPAVPDSMWYIAPSGLTCEHVAAGTSELLDVLREKVGSGQADFELPAARALEKPQDFIDVLHSNLSSEPCMNTSTGRKTVPFVESKMALMLSCWLFAHRFNRYPLLICGQGSRGIAQAFALSGNMDLIEVTPGQTGSSTDLAAALSSPAVRDSLPESELFVNNPFTSPEWYNMMLWLNEHNCTNAIISAPQSDELVNNAQSIMSCCCPVLSELFVSDSENCSAFNCATMKAPADSTGEYGSHIWQTEESEEDGKLLFAASEKLNLSPAALRNMQNMLFCARQMYKQQRGSISVDDARIMELLFFVAPAAALTGDHEVLGECMRGRKVMSMLTPQARQALNHLHRTAEQRSMRAKGQISLF